MSNFLKPLNETGGSIYVFPSADNQMNALGKYDIKFSKFALLNLPPIKTPTNSNNNIQLSTIDGQILNGSTLTNNSNAFIEGLQNYCMNFESQILSSNYDDLLETVSERVFFKWLKELGAIRFEYASANEVNGVERFVEEREIGNNYNRVIEYLGEVQVTNITNAYGNTYREIFMNIPTTVGATPTILFETYSDSNYHPSMVITGGEYLNGRDVSSTHPYSLSTYAFYDYDDVINYTGNNERWMGNNVTQNSYYTEPNMFNNPSNDIITKNLSDYGLLGSTTYIRSQLDGIKIDWETVNYKEIIDNGFDTINDTNHNSNINQFDFNTILLYYDVEDSDGNVATNLYGVLFIDNMVHTITEGSYIPTFTKNKYDNITKLNGNGFGLKLNIKTSSGNSSEVSNIQIINDYETYSLSLYTDALNEMRHLSHQFIDSYSKALEITNKLNSLSNNYTSLQDFILLKNDVDMLKTSFTNSNLIVSDLQSIFDSIDNLSKIVDTILNGNTPLDLNFNYDLLKQGSGINLSKTNNQLTVHNTQQKYNNVTEILLDTSANNQNIVKLREFTNLISINIDSIVTANINLKLDDSSIVWKRNQTVILYFPSGLTLNGYTLNIFTDAKNKLLRKNTFDNLITVVGDNNNGNKIELICVDEYNQQFLVI